MAGRQLQKLLRQDLAAVDEGATSETDESEEELEAERSKPFNPFDLLGEDDQEPESEEEDEDEDSIVESGIEEADQAPQPAPPTKSTIPAPLPNKPPKATSTKAKGKQPASTDGRALTNAGAHGGKASKEEEDIDAILKELNLTPKRSSDGAAPSASTTTSAPAPGERPLLGIDLKSLRPEEELKRIFGSQVVNSSRHGNSSEDSYAGYSRRVRRLAARGLIRRETLKNGALIHPKENWPKGEDGLVVFKNLGVLGKQGEVSFGYEYSPGYMAVHDLYEECQATFDPNSIAALLRAHPYHLDALLTMADLYRSTGEHAYADEMIERCVYALELPWPSSFLSHLTAGTAHVPYTEPNTNLFTALFRYIQSLGRRGLHRTALEVSKLLLSLNPDDPMGVLMCLDYFAVRAGQYKFLYRFIDQYQSGEQSVALFPNMSFSVALAKWYQEKELEQRQSGGGSSSKTKNKSVSQNTMNNYGSSPNGNGLSSWSSQDLLLRAVLLHPLVVVKLQERVKSAGVSLSPAWTRLLSSSLFITVSVENTNPQTASTSLEHLVDIFVERQFQLWKSGPVQDFLFDACTTAAAAAEDTSVAMLDIELPGGLSAEDWSCVRHEAFPPCQANAYRHLRVYEYSDATGRLPIEELHGMQQAAGGGADEAQLRAAAEAAARAGIERLAPEDLQDMNPLMALLRSMLPWVAAGQQPDYAAGGDGNQVLEDAQQEQREEGQPEEEDDEGQQ